MSPLRKVPVVGTGAALVVPPTQRVEVAAPVIPVAVTEVAVGVAKTGVPVRVGESDKTTELLEVPVDVLVPVPPRATARVPDVTLLALTEDGEALVPT